MRSPTPRPAPRSVRLLGLVAALAVVAVAALVVRSRRPSAIPAPGAPSSTPAGAAAVDEAVLREFVAIEAAEAEADRTMLGPELLAQAHGAAIEELWDELQASADGLGTLAAAPFDAWVVPPLPAPESLPHGIRRWTVRGTEGASPLPNWRQPLQAAREGGWKLDRSEWRHVQFTPAAGDQPAASRVDIHLHLTRGRPEARAQVHAIARFDWPLTPPPAAGARLGRMTVEELEIVTRDGPAPFVAQEPRVVEPFPRTSWIDPVILRDLDGDGRCEILLAARNLVLRRAADGTWAESLLSAHHPGLIFTALLADFTGDGVPDLLCAVRGGLSLLRGGAGGAFDHEAELAWAAPERLQYAQAFTCGDLDADGDLDVFLGQYRTPYEGGQMPRPYFDALDGPPAYLLRNEGDGHFTEVTAGSGLEAKRHRRSYGASLADLDGDGDLDLLVSSDFAGADVYANDGRGRFTDVTATWLDEPRAFGMSHALSDFDADGRLDVLLVGMPQPTADRLGGLGLERAGFEAWRRERPRMTFGNRLYFAEGPGPGPRFRQRPAGAAVARAGWCWSAAAVDVDHDRFPDLHLVNGHETRRSVRDYEREFWTRDIYIGDSTPRPAVDAYFGARFAITRAQGWSYGGHDRNRFHLNLGGTNFVEIGHLLGLVLPEDCRNVVAEDFDGDGDVDFAVTTFEIWPEVRQTLRLFENRLPVEGHWIAFRLPEGPGIPSPVGARVTVRDDRGAQVRVWVTGDGYRSQQPPVVRFGLGDLRRIETATVTWPGGRRVEMAGLTADLLHAVPPPPP